MRSYILRVIEDKDLPQGSQEWLDYRKGKIGASMAPAIMGMSPWKTRLQLWEEFFDDKEKIDTAAMKRGRDLEPEARQYLNNKYGVELKPVVVEHPTYYEWHFSSLDGFYQREDGSIFAVEIKCPGSHDHEIAKQGKIPDHYIPQLNHQLEDMPMVDEILYFSYHPSSPVELWHKRNQNDLQSQLKEELSFKSSIIDCIPPKACDRDTVVIIDPTASNEARILLELTEQKNIIERQIEESKTRLKELINKQPRCKIGNLNIIRSIRPGAIDYEKIPELKGVDRNVYRKSPIEVWSFYKEKKNG
jgi:putative phage-type endonuclease